MQSLGGPADAPFNDGEIKVLQMTEFNERSHADFVAKEYNSVKLFLWGMDGPEPRR